MIDDIDNECGTVALIKTASEFTFWDNVVWLNRSQPGLTILEDIGVTNPLYPPPPALSAEYNLI
jgi:hypothetical protein